MQGAALASRYASITEVTVLCFAQRITPKIIQSRTVVLSKSGLDIFQVQKEKDYPYTRDNPITKKKRSKLVKQDFTEVSQDEEQRLLNKKYPRPEGNSLECYQYCTKSTTEYQQIQKYQYSGFAR